MKMKRRNSFEITAEILRLAMKGAKKTHIVYGANLNFKLLGEYLERMEKSGLIKNHGERGLIYTTDYGRMFLENFENLEKIVKPD